MKILLAIHHSLDPNSGAPGTVLRLGEIYKSLGHDVTFFSFDNLPNFLPNLSKALLFPACLAAHLLNYSDRQNFDIIDASTGDAWLLGSFFPRPCVLVTHSHGLEHVAHEELLKLHAEGQRHLSWKYSLYRGSFRLWEVGQSLRSADVVFLLNQQDRKYTEEVLKINPQKVHVIPNGLPDYFLGQRPLIDIQDKMPIKIAQIGSYIERKGIRYSSPALNSILEEFPQVQISFLGSLCLPEQLLKDFNSSFHHRITIIPRGHFE